MATICRVFSVGHSEVVDHCRSPEAVQLAQAHIYCFAVSHNEAEREINQREVFVKYTHAVFNFWVAARFDCPESPGLYSNDARGDHVFGSVYLFPLTLGNSALNVERAVRHDCKIMI